MQKLHFLTKVPLPACGVMLGTASLGTLWQNWAPWPYYILGPLAGFLFVLLVMKLVFFPKMFFEDMKSPIFASVVCTFSMSLMVLSTYLAQIAQDFAYGVWWFSIALHIGFMIYFSIVFMLRNFQLENVHATYFIVYVGLVVASVTSPQYDAMNIGEGIFWFGFIALLLLMVLITWRYIRCRQIAEGAKALACIYGAPWSLCIAGYTQSVANPSYGFLVTMYVVACVMYAVAFVVMVRCAFFKFYPSCASFTFPFVISATATMQVGFITDALGAPIPLAGWGLTQTIIATILVSWTYGRYMCHIFSKRGT